MKYFNDYTTAELDELYSKLSEVAQDFVYSDIIAEEVANVGKETGLHLDKWQSLNTLVLETLLGIVPSSEFQSEVARRLSTTPEITSAIVTHMDDEIFSVVRDESVEEYAETNEKNISVGAIYDEAQDVIGDIRKTDPYRESSDLPHTRGPVITEEKLHIVDELFAPYQPKIKPLTQEDGSVRMPTEEAPHEPELFSSSKENSSVVPVINTPVSSVIITKEMLEAEDASASKNSFVGMEKLEEIIKELPPLAPGTEDVSILNISEEKIVPEVQEGSKKIKLHIEKSSLPGGKLKIHIQKVDQPQRSDTQEQVIPVLGETESVSKTLLTEIPKKIKPTDQAHPSDIIPHAVNPHYSVDPYKEIL